MKTTETNTIRDLVRVHKFTEAIQVAREHGLEELVAERIEYIARAEVNTAKGAFYQISNFDPSVWRLDDLVMNTELLLDSCEKALKNLSGEFGLKAYHSVRNYRKSFAASRSDYVEVASIEEKDGNIDAAIRIYSSLGDRNIHCLLYAIDLEKKRDNNDGVEAIYRKAISSYEHSSDYLNALILAHYVGHPEKVQQCRHVLLSSTETSKDENQPLSPQLFLRVMSYSPYVGGKRALELLLDKELHPFFQLVLNEHPSGYREKPHTIEPLCALLNTDASLLDTYQAIGKELEKTGSSLIECLLSFEPVLASEPFNVDKVKKNMAALRNNVVPQKRGIIFQHLLQREVLHPVFDYVLARMEQFTEPSKLQKVEDFILSALSLNNDKLEVHHQALKSTVDEFSLFFELDAAAKREHASFPKWTSLEHYDHFSAALIAERSSLFVPGSLAQYVVTTARPQGNMSGIRERMLREVDAIGYLFREMYPIAQSQTFKTEADFRKEAVRYSVKLWKDKQKHFLAPEVLETLTHINFNLIFEPGSKTQDYLETGGMLRPPGHLSFLENPALLLSRILDKQYYDREIQHQGLSDGFINAINRLNNGLSTSWTFEEMRCEFNENPLHDFFNKAAECTGNNGKYQRYGYAHKQDSNIGIIAANLYESGKHKSTVGKAFLARGKDREGKELLYVDGVVMLQDIADFLAEPKKEARWMPMYTKAILQTAMANQLDEVVFNTSHKLAQRSVWQYIRHFAELVGLQENQDFKYAEGRMDDGSKGRAVNIKTMSDAGFELAEEVVGQNYHYVEKIPDAAYTGEHLLEGFWINHWDRTKSVGNGSRVPEFVKPVDHREVPQINDGRGYIIGFRRKTAELVQLFQEKYGEEYAIVK